MSIAATPAMPQEPAFFGWRVAWAAFAVAVFGWGVSFYGPPIFLPAIQAARGWSVALVSAAITSHLLAADATLAIDLYTCYEQLCGDKWPPLEVMLQLLPHCSDEATAAELCDRLLEELRAQKSEEPRQMIVQKLNAAIEKLVQNGRAAEGRLFAEKLGKLLQRPQLETSS